MQRTWRTTCQRTVMNVRRAANLFRGSRARATFAPHEVATPCAAGRPALWRVRVLHLQPGKTRPSARVRGPRGGNRAQRHQPQLSRRGGLRAARRPANARGDGDGVVGGAVVRAAPAAGSGARAATVRPRHRQRGIRAHADADHSAGAIHRMDARNGSAPLERRGVLNGPYFLVGGGPKAPPELAVPPSVKAAVVATSPVIPTPTKRALRRFDNCRTCTEAMALFGNVTCSPFQSTSSPRTSSTDDTAIRTPCSASPT